MLEIEMNSLRTIASLVSVAPALWLSSLGVHAEEAIEGGHPRLVVQLAHPHSIISAAFSPDGMRVVTGGAMTARVWDAKTGMLLSTLQGHTDWVSMVAFSPDGSRIVTASRDKSARVWDARTGQELL